MLRRPRRHSQEPFDSKFEQPPFLARIQAFNELLRVTREFENLHAFIHVGLVRGMQPIDLALAATYRHLAIDQGNRDRSVDPNLLRPIFYNRKRFFQAQSKEHLNTLSADQTTIRSVNIFCIVLRPESRDVDCLNRIGKALQGDLT
jgi:hypothetical protein